MKFTIFYSWQSDLPNNTNRGFLESTIEKAIKDIGKDDNFEIEPSLDRDTKGTPGSPNISHTILKKIKACDVFIADISIVTGNKGTNQRLSPNPNVLIELGYAVSILGWEKIILICNEVYGKDEDLPFDIRQNRRIPYYLLPEDPKAPIKETLSKHLKGRIVEIAQNLRNPIINSKEPDLLIEWNLLKFIMPRKPFEEHRTNEIILPVLNEYPNVSDVIRKELKEVDMIDGSFDPEWELKIDKYKNKTDKFLNDIKSEKGNRNYFIDTYSHLATLLTISVTNKGTIPASDIRVEIKLPKWICAFEKWPEKYDIPQKPDVPIPTPPSTNLVYDNELFSGINSIYGDSIVSPLNLPTNHNRSSACYLKNRDTIYLWADKLLHKHTLTLKNDRFYLLAKPDAVEGEYINECNYFCVEYHDWKKLNLKIVVQKEIFHQH